ncbi:LSU ribosomal protein L6P [Pseudoxanthobacter soli DSM 19599]|uniref:Large ribosomal subunit protein uL6 n=1 Tax=Pseudoxanthobacter soli DSM 19599 TaxID=1123029 RepID=A0A1M7ZRN8_9HYPH|nr:50S ribosomal protein L6 [Pseudoxanthobacter soli]SHO67570.1 LSU ribosomal protein L6P [Pseudoxanthobacter soli DSM 19599]
MSRIGKKPVVVPGGITATVDGQTVSVKGPKGQLAFVVHDLVAVEQTADGITVTPRDESKKARSLWGMSRTMVSNLVVGVSKGFERKLEITGVGYKAAVQGNSLNLSLGYSHDVAFPIPEGITITCAKPTEILVSGIDKQKVGQVAAEIREWRQPEPYKGKGVRYAGEFIVRKEGKKK